MADQYRSDEARRRREDLAASWSREPPDPASGQDDTLVLFFMCCHPALAPSSAVALTLRALGGLTTREIAAAFLVPEATMAQRISRAKRTLADAGESFASPTPDARAERLALVLRVVYLVFNEGYASSGGPDLDARPTSPPRPSGSAGCCTSCCPTSPSRPASSPSCC